MLHCRQVLPGVVGQHPIQHVGYLYPYRVDEGTSLGHSAVRRVSRPDIHRVKGVRSLGGGRVLELPDATLLRVPQFAHLWRQERKYESHRIIL